MLIWVPYLKICTLKKIPTIRVNLIEMGRILIEMPIWLVNPFLETKRD